MHPVVRVASFLVITISLAHINPLKLITAAIVLLLLFFLQPSIIITQQIFKLIFRLRWLFISIFFIYAWFTPGLLLIPEWGAYSPSQEGTVMGLLRVAALIIITAAVSLLVLRQSQDELVSAIYWYGKPLTLFGISQQRLAARLILTIASVKKLQSRWTNTAADMDTSNNRIQNNYQRILQLFKEVIKSAEADELQTISFTLLAPPVWYQWFIPLSLLLVFWVSH